MKLTRVKANLTPGHCRTPKKAAKSRELRFFLRILKNPLPKKAEIELVNLLNRVGHVGVE
jgi:hypothetical protein